MVRQMKKLCGRKNGVFVGRLSANQRIIVANSIIPSILHILAPHNLLNWSFSKIGIKLI